MGDDLRLPFTDLPVRDGAPGVGGTFGESPTTGSDTWLTPRHIVDALGPFDLDPCAAPDPRPWPTAVEHRAEADGDGMVAPWSGLVWLNPPYSEAHRWVRRLAVHRCGIALLPTRFETALWRHDVWPTADLIAVLDGRQRFHRADGTPGPFTAATATALVAYGALACERLRRALTSGPLVGTILTAWDRPRDEQDDDR